MPVVAERRKKKVPPSECTDPIHALVKELTKPAPPSPARPATSSADVMAIPVGRLIRHPDNRRPTPEQIARLAESIQVEGQLEPVVVRELPPGHAHRGEDWQDDERCFQIISGETRAEAQRQLGAVKLPARELRDCDDARALELLAVFNAARDDLNPIQKARMIARLCDRPEIGGAGLTREAAGKVYGFKTGSPASNLIRLLELPKPLIALIESGQLPYTFGLVALGYVAVPGITPWVVKEVASWKGEDPGRESFEDDLRREARKQTRSMTAANRKHLDQWNINHCSERLFDLDDKTREQLGVVTLKLWNGEEERATNCKRWEQLQAAAKKEVAKKIAKRSQDRPSKADTRERTPAEQRALEKEQDEQLAKRIRGWGHEWKRFLIAEKLRQKVPDHWVLNKIVVWSLAQQWGYSEHGQLQVDQTVIELAGGKGDVADVLTHQTATSENLLKLICTMLMMPEKNPDRPVWPFTFVDQLVADLEIDLADAWFLMQSSGDADGTLGSFYALHNGRQLRALAKELDVYVADNVSKSGALKILSAVERIVRMPKALAPVGEKKRKAK